MLSALRNSVRKNAPPEVTAHAFNHKAGVETKLGTVGGLPTFELKVDTLSAIKGDIDSARAAVKDKSFKQTYSLKHEEKALYNGKVAEVAHGHAPEIEKLAKESTLRLTPTALAAAKTQVQLLKSLTYAPKELAFLDVPIQHAESRLATAADFAQVNLNAIRTANPSVSANRNHAALLQFMKDDGAIPSTVLEHRLQSLTPTVNHSLHVRLMQETDAVVRAYESLVATNGRADAGSANKQIKKLVEAETGLRNSGVTFTSFAQKLQTRMSDATTAMRKNAEAAQQEHAALQAGGFSNGTLGAALTRSQSFSHHATEASTSA